MPVPVESTLVFPSSSSLDAPATGGRRKDWTCPPERPTARIGSVGWSAWAKRSEESGSVQRFSNISGKRLGWCQLALVVVTLLRALMKS